MPADRRIAVVHLDVEGHECEALAGGTAMIRRCRPTLVVETKPAADWLGSALGDCSYVETGAVCGNTILAPTA